MSWAAHNPEAYEECERKGVLRWLGEKSGMDLHMVNRETADLFDDLLITIQSCNSKAWDALTLAANKQICEAEANYLISAGGGDR